MREMPGDANAGADTGDLLSRRKSLEALAMTPTPDDVIAFWQQAGPDRWFARDDAFDAAITERFGALHAEAAAGRLAAWGETAEGAFALVILLDQFSRNIFRSDPRTWAADPLARAVADRAIARGFDHAVAPELRRFFYLPYMHSEDWADQERSVALNRSLEDPDLVKWAEHHRDIIARFGRFPHRNAILGRETTPEEQRFLDEGGFGG
jgi:uncharacterized protein (DUF924 family)